MCATNEIFFKSKIKYLFIKNNHYFKFAFQIIIFSLWMFSLNLFVAANDMTDEWKYPNNCFEYSCDYRAKWQYLEKTDEIQFIISTKFRNKWTGIGFSNTKKMKGTDAVIGLIEENGRYFLMDTYLGDYQTPPLDAVQNIHNMSVWRENGITHLQFHRFRKTSDPQFDFQFTDENCAYFHFPVKGGVYNAISKRLRKHEEIPIVSEHKICIRAKDYLNRIKQNQINSSSIPVRLNVPKNKIPIRFKSRTKLIATGTTQLSDLNKELTTKVSSQLTQNSTFNLQNYTEENIIKNKLYKKVTSPYQIDLSKFETIFANSTNASNNTKISLLTTVLPSNVNVQKIFSSTLSSVSTTKPNLNLDDNFKNNEEKNDYIEEDEETNEDERPNLINFGQQPSSKSKNELEMLNKNLDEKNDLNNNNIINEDNSSGRIKINLDSNNNLLQTLIFELKIFDKNQLNLNDVYNEALKDLSDITGFKKLNILNLNKTNERKQDKIAYLAKLQLQLQSEPETNKTDYLIYILNQLNETVSSGQLGSLELDPNYFYSLKQDTNTIQSDIEPRYVFEYNLFNHIKIKLTKDQLKLVYIICGVLLLIILVLIQACCICLNSSSINNNFNNQNNLSNSSTLQDKHQLNIYHQHHDHNINKNNHNSNYSQFSNAYDEYMKAESNGGYSYENFVMKSREIDLNNSSRNNSKYKNNSLNKYENKHETTYKRKPQNFHDSYDLVTNNLNRSRYFEPTGQISDLQPDFYFMPHQRRYSGEIVRMFVDYNDLQFVSK